MGAGGGAMDDGCAFLSKVHASAVWHGVWCRVAGRPVAQGNASEPATAKVMLLGHREIARQA